MKFKIFVSMLLSFSVQPASAYFYELQCKGNFQPQIGRDTETVLLASVDPKGSGDLKLTASLREYAFEVVWHKALDTFYMTIKKGTQNIAFSTARVPTFEHNDTMTDVTMPDGTRTWISCSYKPK